MKELPEEIKFGFRRLKVEYDHRISMQRELIATGDTVFGVTVIQKSLSREVMAQAIFRFIHSTITDLCVPDMSKEDSRALGIQVFAVLRGNPGLLDPGRLFGALDAGYSHVTIAGSVWSIIREPEHYNLAGRKINTDMTLHISSLYSNIDQWQTLIHELYHVIYEVLSLDDEYPDAIERDVDLMSFMLCMVLMDNDFEWLIDKEKEVSGDG